MDSLLNWCGCKKANSNNFDHKITIGAKGKELLIKRKNSENSVTFGPSGM